MLGMYEKYKLHVQTSMIILWQPCGGGTAGISYSHCAVDVKTKIHQHCSPASSQNHLHDACIIVFLCKDWRASNFNIIHAFLSTSDQNFTQISTFFSTCLNFLFLKMSKVQCKGKWKRKEAGWWYREGEIGEGEQRGRIKAEGGREGVVEMWSGGGEGWHGVLWPEGPLHQLLYPFSPGGEAGRVMRAHPCFCHKRLCGYTNQIMRSKMRKIITAELDTTSK